MARPQATHSVLVDDAKVRVTRWDFAPGAETGWHRHGMDYVITTLTPCTFLMEEPGARAGASTCRPAKAIVATKASSTMW